MSGAIVRPSDMCTFRTITVISSPIVAKKTGSNVTEITHDNGTVWPMKDKNWMQSIDFDIQHSVT